VVLPTGKALLQPGRDLRREDVRPANTFYRHIAERPEWARPPRITSVGGEINEDVEQPGNSNDLSSALTKYNTPGEEEQRRE
jgi:hypothetical protein